MSVDLPPRPDPNDIIAKLPTITVYRKPFKGEKRQLKLNSQH